MQDGEAGVAWRLVREVHHFGQNLVTDWIDGAPPDLKARDGQIARFVAHGQERDVRCLSKFGRAAATPVTDDDDAAGPAHGIGGGLGAVGTAGLGQDIAHMRCHGVQADLQHQGDIGVAAADGQKPQDLQFPRG